MKILCLDTETTGLPRFDRPADDACQPRICAIACILFNPDEPPERDLTVYDLVAPHGWTVPADAERIHGLTTTRLMAEGSPIHSVLDRFLVAFELCDMLTAFNSRFDAKVLRGELRRDHRPDRYGQRPEIDCMRASLPHCKIAPTHAMMAAGFRANKMPTLAEAYEILLHKPLAGAHDALVDAKATVEIFRWLKANGKLPCASYAPRF